MIMILDRRKKDKSLVMFPISKETYAASFSSSIDSEVFNGEYKLEEKSNDSFFRLNLPCYSNSQISNKKFSIEIVLEFHAYITNITTHLEEMFVYKV